MISSFSVISAVLVFNLALVLVYLLRRRSGFLINCGTGTLVFIAALGFVRLLSPLDFEFSLVIHSETVLPAIRDLLIAPIGGRLSLGSILLLFWAAGTVAFAARDIGAIVRDKRARSRYVSVECERAEAAAAALGLESPIIVSPAVSAPHVAGFFRPAICLPPLELSVEQWQYVLRHEARHIAARDTLIKLFYSLVRALFWWNPISHLFMRELDALLELRCDAYLARSFSEEEKLDYFAAALSVMKQLAPGTCPAGELRTGLVKSGGDLMQRFEVLLLYDRAKTRRLRNAVCALALTLFLGSYCFIIQPVYEPPPEEMEGVHSIPGDTTDDSFIFCQNGEYMLYINGYVACKLTEEQVNEPPYNQMDFYRAKE